LDENARNGTKRMTTWFVVAELLWGTTWALFLQFTRLGRYLAGRQTWASVVVGVGGTLALSYPVVDGRSWWRTCGAFALSSVGIIARSLLNDQRLEGMLAAHGGEQQPKERTLLD
jgi:hypothetical protein